MFCCNHSSDQSYRKNKEYFFADIVRGEPPYHDTELLYRRHPSVRPRSSIRPRPCSRQPCFGSHLDNAFQHLRSRGRQRSQRGMPTRVPVLPAVYRAPLPQFSAFIFIYIHTVQIHSFRSFFLFYPSQPSHQHTELTLGLLLHGVLGRISRTTVVFIIYKNKLKTYNTQ